MRQFSLFIVLFLHVLLLGEKRGFAQKTGQLLIDSLLKELPGAKEDTNKVNLLNNLSMAYSDLNADEAIKYALRELDLAGKLGWKKGAANANNVLGAGYLNKSESSKALESFLQSIKIYEETGDMQGMAKVTGNIGAVYMDLSDFPKAQEYHFKQLAMFEKLGNKAGLAIVLGNIGLAYFDLSDFNKALEYDGKALKMSEEIKDRYGVATMMWNMGLVYEAQSKYPEAIGNFLEAQKIFETIDDKKDLAVLSGDIGIVYDVQGNHDRAMDFFFTALKISEELKDKYSIAISTQNIGNSYAQRREDDKALEYLLKSLKLFEETGNKNGVLSVSMNVGSVYSNQHNYTMAIELLQRSAQMAEEVGDRHQLALAFVCMGSSFLDLVKDTTFSARRIKSGIELPMEKYKVNGAIPEGNAARLNKAVENLERAVEIAKAIQTPDVLQVGYEALSQAYRLKENYEKALDYANKYMAIKDSVFSKESNAKIVKLDMKNEYDRKHFADSLKTDEREKITGMELKRQRSYTVIGVAGILLLAGFSYFIVKERGKSEKERKKSEELLLNILPDEVASELKASGSSAARHYDNVTVLFTDFVNFTQAGEKMSPQALIDELHACFKAFDEITAKYNIEKIKTIGDAYLAVAGLPVPDALHAVHIVSAAVEINNFMSSRYARLGDRTFEVRIGIHSGSVVAGIVGVKKFAYDIWGDTVNTAARMEQSSEAGKINISETTYDLVKDKFTCAYRGEIDAKNKGKLKMYYVDSDVPIYNTLT